MFGGIRSRIDPYQLYLYGIEAPSSFFVSLAQTTAIVYYITSGRLNPLQLVTLGTAVELSYFIMQIPTGVLADLVSRRLCVVAGWILVGGGLAEQGLSPTFANLIVGQFVIGLGAALQEGAQDAWIADELDEAVMTPVYLRATQLGLICGVAGSLLSAVIADERLYLPLLVGGLAICLTGIALGFVMPERNPPRTATDISETETEVAALSWKLFTAQIRASKTAIIAVPGFVLLLGTTFFVGMWSESFDRLWGDFLVQDIGLPKFLGLSPSAWFSAIAVAVALLSLGSTQLAKRRVDRLGHAAAGGVLLTVTVLIGLGVLTMACAHGFAVAIAAYLLVQALRPITYPLFSGWIVSRVNPRMRATALSARDMFDSGGQIVGGPAVGWIGVVGTVRTALYAGVIALGPAIGLLALGTRRMPVKEIDPEP